MQARTALAGRVNGQRKHPHILIQTRLACEGSACAPSGNLAWYLNLLLVPWLVAAGIALLWEAVD